MISAGQRNVADLADLQRARMTCPGSALDTAASAENAAEDAIRLMAKWERLLWQASALSIVWWMATVIVTTESIDIT